MKGPEYANHIIAFINSLSGWRSVNALVSHRCDPGSCYKLRVTNLDKQPMYVSVRPSVCPYSYSYSEDVSNICNI